MAATAIAPPPITTGTPVIRSGCSARKYDVSRTIALSKATYRKMVQNLWWAAGYNIFAIPLAAGVLAPWGVVLPAAVGALLMSLSTIIVALNAQLLRRVRL
jgi:Cu2+-exporting ATPase